MVTQVLTIGLYCPQTGETVMRQACIHGGPFDTADAIVTRLCVAACPEGADHYEVVEDRRSRNPKSATEAWSQLRLFGASDDPEPATQG